MDERSMLLRVVEQFARTGSAQEGGVTVTQIQDFKTTFVEQIGEGGRSVMMNEYKVDGKTYWAGYSSKSNTVYLSSGWATPN